MAFEKITDTDLEGKGNVGKPDTPGVDTSEMQRILDEIPRDVIVPKFNLLLDALQDALAASFLGANIPNGLPEETGKNVQNVIQAVYNALNVHKSDETNPHKVTASQTGAYTKAETNSAIDQKVVDIGAGDMAKIVYDPDHLNEDLGVQLYTHSKSGTVHNFVGTGMNGRAKITAPFTNGDTVQLNGSFVTATCGQDPVDDDTIVTGKWVTFVADTEGGQINFKGGGGLSAKKLAESTAEPSNVLFGKTYYSGNKIKKTGNMPNLGAWTETISPGESVVVPQGWHNGSGKVIAENPAVNWNMRVINGTTDNNQHTENVGAPDGEGTYAWGCTGFIHSGNENSHLKFDFMGKSYPDKIGNAQNFSFSGTNKFTSATSFTYRCYGGGVNFYFCRVR